MPKIQCPVAGCQWQSQELDAAFADVLTAALGIHDRTEHGATPTPAAAAPAPAPRKQLRLDPPKIGASSELDQWSAFTRQWHMYKTGMDIPANMLTTALFYCCSDDLRTDIMRDLRDDVATMPEETLLAAMKRLAVREESTLVHRIKLNQMTQPPGTGIRTFLANLRGQAALCGYTATCSVQGCGHTFDYSDEIIKDNLVRGIADPEILADLLGDTKTDRTLEQTVSFVAQKEQGKATRSVMGDKMGAMGLPPGNKRTASKSTKCWACGGPRHAQKNDRYTREKSCEAWTFTCGKCSTKGHYTSCCSKCSDCGSWGHANKSFRSCTQNTQRRRPRDRSSDHRSTTDEHDKADFVYDQLCTIQNSGHDTDDTQERACVAGYSNQYRHNPPIEHHIFDGRWIPRPSKPHPSMAVRLTLCPQDHAILGHPMIHSDISSLTSLDTQMVADSGCQSSIMPMKSALAMGIDTRDIIPVKLTMRGAISEDLGVTGGVVVTVSTTDGGGSTRTAKQLIYVSNKMTNAFLCREALVNLGAIPASFPTVPASTAPTTAASIAAEPATPFEHEHVCSCPKRAREPPPLPTELPTGLEASEENIPALKQWILDYYSSTTFNVCEHQTLPMMQCEPLELHVDPSAKPLAIHKPALVPIHWHDKVLQDLERDVRIGVLEKVSPNTPVTWCSRMVVTAKADGTPRRTVDLQHLNKHSVRQTHHVPSPFLLASRVPQNTLKTVTDAWNGYHSVPIREEDRHLTTFITPWGRYRYKVAPQGFIASGDGYNQRFDSVISEFPNKVKCVDDTLKWQFSIADAFFHTCQWCDLLARNGIILNPSKFQFAQHTVDYAGLSVTPTNIGPSVKFLDAIRNFPTPKDISGARAWFGLVNQGAYAFASAHQMKPFRHLLKPSTLFGWTEELDEVFQKSKEVIVKEMEQGVRLFDAARPTCLATDWSVDGIGFLLMQKYCDCQSRIPTCCPEGWQVCLVGSRFTSPAESRYAPVEGEALAVVYALHQTRYYVLGCTDLIIATDHKPLLRILNDRALVDIDNRRLLNLKEKTLAYRFSMVHVPGQKNSGPDAASRYPANPHDHEPPLLKPMSEVSDTDIAEDCSVVAAATTTLNAITNTVTWDMVREATLSDELLTQLAKLIRDGFPENSRELTAELKPYHRYASSLCCMDGVLLLGHRIVIPSSLRPAILDALHAAHQGINAMIARAGDSVFWPNLTTDITKVRDQCGHCHRVAKSNPMQPPSTSAPPEYPFQQLCCDYFTYLNKEYLVLVDRYSNWPAVFKSESGATGLIKRLRETFVTFGIPEELSSDGGSEFTAGKTQEFLTSWGVRHRISSVANPHSNCRAEIAVKTVKRMLMDNTGATGSLDTDKFQRAMLVYRNSIDPETRASPALVVFGRPIRDAIPIPMGRYCPHSTWQETLANREQALARRHSREHEKWEEHTHSLPPLRVGDHVYLQNLVGNHPRRWERTGVIVEVRQYHQYVVRVDGSGRVTLRNRQHLRKYTPFLASAPSSVLRKLPVRQPLPAAQPPSTHSPGATGVSPPSVMPKPILVKPRVADSRLPSSLQSPLEGDIPRTKQVTFEEPDSDIPDAPPNADEGVPEITDGPNMTDGQSAALPEQTPVPKQRLPLAITRLLPHNSPGLSEAPTSRRRAK